MKSPERTIYAFIATLTVIGTLILAGFGLTQDYLSKPETTAPAVVQVEPAPPAPEPVVVAPDAPVAPEPIVDPLPEPIVYTVTVPPVAVEPVIVTEPCRPSGKPVYHNPYTAR